MKLLRLMLIPLLAVFWLPSDGLGLEETLPSLLYQRISLDLRDMDISEALKFLAVKASMNIITTKNVTGRVTLTVENVPIKDIFDIMLRSNSLAYDLKGDIYNVMTEIEYKTLYGKNFYDLRKVKVLRLKYAIPENAFNMLEAIKSEIGRVLVDSESGNVVIMDTPERIAQLESTLEQFEQADTIEVFNLKYAHAKDVEEVLKSRLDAKNVGSIRSDERNNQLIVKTFPNRMEEIRHLIKRLDRQTKQVLIDTKIIKIKLSDQLDTGVEWEGIFKVMERHGLGYVGTYPFSVVQDASSSWQSRSTFLDGLGGIDVGAFPFSGTTSNFAASTKKAAGENVHIGMVDPRQDLDVVINYLETIGETRILSNPKILAVHNTEAKIHVGEKQAYVTTTTTTGQTTSAISEEVTFVKVGIELSVTPIINDDGFIIMNVKPEISTVVSTYETPTGNKIPIVDTSMAETTVMIMNHSTLVIGGLRKEEEIDSGEQFPILGNIPILNLIFRSGTKTTERTELLVMLTPHILTGVDLEIGNERQLTESPGKPYRDYQPLTAERQIYDGDVSPLVKPDQAFREYIGIVEETGEPVAIKEKMYEPRQTPPTLNFSSKVKPKGYREADLDEDGSTKQNFIIKETMYESYPGSGE